MSLYQGKIILAPMVRVSNVGFRVFCAAQGADIVFSEEVVAARLGRCRREVRAHNDDVGLMIEFVAYEPFKNQYKRSVVFTTPARAVANQTSEGAPIVLQLGVSDAAVGAAAALLCCEDVDGIDVNMGCPKKFSVSNGMGAALMRDTSKAAAILLAIDDAVNAPDMLTTRGRRVPLSFKIRLLETAEATADMLISIMEKVGPNHVHAVTLHARTVDQTSETPPHYDRAAETVKRLRSHPLFKEMCFVLNGSVRSREDGETKTTQFGFDAAMIARHAMWDMSVFSSNVSSMEGHNALGSEADELPFAYTSWMDLYRDLLRCHAKYCTPFNFVKYHITRSISCIPAMKHLMVAIQQEAHCYEDVARILALPVEEQVSMRGVARMEMVLCVPMREFVLDAVCHRNDDAASGEEGGGDEGAAAPVLKKQRKE
ncbi:putative dihydrouridine synthase [Trypanosoma rangeli]|uniref:Putative dihydrouridine synthase n=1 Tax=Trypanosoma rangeli TaxID=5698 RepID=A0A422P287_TRYRA|nr:putative dihydrouridine synthase [Trypanosoma rangeli]RNF11843.1 putative dihydrouridine synthase [Trypanosoma rangeli]|eukprot:RNF11843.1 putative dihydrouridine synthase [Trypanosoma rangeli]